MKFRRTFIELLALLMLAAALCRMAQLAGPGGDSLRQEALRIAEVHGELSAIRGRILDAAGAPLAWSVRRYDLAVKWDDTGNGEELRRAVRGEFGSGWGNLDDLAPGAVIKYDLTMKELEKADALCRKYPALEVNLAWDRLYSENADLSVIGKVQQIRGMEVGISGLEAEWEETLKGHPGRFRVMADRHGRWIDESFRIEREPEAGQDVILDEETGKAAP